MLAIVVKILAGLHGRNIAHGALSPPSVIWQSRDNTMYVANLCCVAAPGELALHVTPTLRFSLPEVPVNTASGLLLASACLASS